jgi:hypothetical protein
MSAQRAIELNYLQQLSVESAHIIAKDENVHTQQASCQQLLKFDDEWLC